MTNPALIPVINPFLEDLAIMISSASSDVFSQSRRKCISNIFPLFSGLSFFSSSMTSFSTTQYSAIDIRNMSSDSTVRNVPRPSLYVLSTAYIHTGNNTSPTNTMTHGRYEAVVIRLSISTITSSFSPSQPLIILFIFPYMTNDTTNVASMSTPYTIGSVSAVIHHI